MQLREVPGFGGLYSVTNDGRVWSAPRSWVAGKGVQRSHPGSWISPLKASNGYLKVNVHVGGSRRQALVHRLVALAWIGSPPDGYDQVNHINGDKSDNRAENLEWCSASQNRQHAWKTGLVTVTPGFLESVRRNARIARQAKSQRMKGTST